MEHHVQPRRPDDLSQPRSRREKHPPRMQPIGYQLQADPVGCKALAEFSRGLEIGVRRQAERRNPTRPARLHEDGDMRITQRD